MTHLISLLYQPAVADSLNILLAICGGSFITMLVSRYPQAIAAGNPVLPALCWPGSHCQNCKTSLRWWHLLPIVSYVLLSGRCHACKTKFGLDYFAIELAALLLGLLLCLYYQAFEPRVLAFTLICLALAIIDFKIQILPDFLTLGGIWLGLICSALGFGIPIADAVVGAALFYCAGVAIELAYKFLRGRDGLGRGDSKLMAMFAVWLGVQASLYALLIGVSLALVYSLSLLCLRKISYNQAISFGPFLIIGALLVLFYLH